MPSNNESSPNALSVTDRSGEGALSIIPSASFQETLWYRITEICANKTLPADPSKRELIVPWTFAFSVLPQIAKLKGIGPFEIDLDEVCQTRFRQFQEERKAVAAARSATREVIVDEEKIKVALMAAGFSRRQLKPFQTSDVAKLIALPHGANFSVPGAGKTTVALAVYALTKQPDTILFVVAPKNAFGAWEEGITDCFVPNAPDTNGEPFIRLFGDETSLSDLLYAGGHKFLITYERFTRYVEVFTNFFCRRKVHVVLDESHRVKAGVLSLRGQAILSIAALPTRRDILSGTPLPHNVTDLVPQLDFLWPGQRMSSLLEGGLAPKQALKNLYVRTTKSQLDLLPPIRRFKPVPMSPFHAALYGILRDETLQQIANIRHAQIDIISARRSVMRLLQASTSPRSTLFKILGGGETLPVESLIEGLVAEGDSNKIIEVCRFVRELHQSGRKVVIWTIFTDTILRLEELLRDIQPLTLRGATPTGDADDEDTREGRIKLFHNSSTHGVLIANPAACSEGISLHTVCHDAVYVDRSYNAAHYLQSVDRIHRIGLPPGVEDEDHNFSVGSPCWYRLH